MHKKVRPYSKLATIYDFVMRHVNYKRWHRFVLELCVHYRVAPKTALEMACGTGTMCRLLSKKGISMTGMDLCYGMVEQAHKKTRGKQIPFVNADMRAIPFKGPFDLVICLYDSANYLMEEKDVTAMLEGAAKVMHPESLFIFDVCTVYNSEHYFWDIVDTESGDGFYYERRSRFRAKDSVQENNFKIYLHDGEKMQNFEEQHRQHIYDLKVIERLIGETGLYDYEMFDGFSFEYPDDQSTRVHFGLRLKNPA